MITFYDSEASRTADVSRSQNVDPQPGAGVLAEVIFDGSKTITLTPATHTFNNESTPLTILYAKVLTENVLAGPIEVTVSYLKLES